MLLYLKNKFSFILFINLISIFIMFNLSYSQVISVSIGNVPIPDGYKSWSLFLISNPEWILPEKNENLNLLYEQFKAFGDAIGPEHIAVWFSEGEATEPWESKPTDIKDVDFLRSSAFCSKLKLPPSKSPYILITTEYPGEGLLSDYPKSFNEFENYAIVELNNLSAQEIIIALNEIADQLLTQDISNISINTKSYWDTLQKSYEGFCNKLVTLSKKISFSINTSFFKFEIKEGD